MKNIIISGILLMTIVFTYGQVKPDTIEIKKALGTVFRQHGKNLKPNQLLNITQPNPEAYKEMKTAKSNYAAGSLIGFAGGFLIGWPLGTALSGGKANWALAGVGAGLFVISIPFTSAYTRHAKNAVRLYNKGLSDTGYHQTSLQFGLAHQGIGLKMTF
jgi:hypothetical protein